MNQPLIGSYAITQTFGENPASYARYGLRGHNGIDYACPIGTPVYAVADGRVIKAGQDPAGYGDYIKVQYDGYADIYAHLSYRLVSVGDNVMSGQVICRTGSTGNSTGPHLHHERRPDDEPRDNGYNGAVDPLVYPAAVTVKDKLPADMVLTADMVNLRGGPAIEDNILGLMREGAQVMGLDRDGPWVRVQVTGWMHGDYLEVRDA